LRAGGSGLPGGMLPGILGSVLSRSRWGRLPGTVGLLLSRGKVTEKVYLLISLRNGQDLIQTEYLNM